MPVRDASLDFARPDGRATLGIGRPL